MEDPASTSAGCHPGTTGTLLPVSTSGQAKMELHAKQDSRSNKKFLFIMQQVLHKATPVLHCWVTECDESDQAQHWENVITAPPALTWG